MSQRKLNNWKYSAEKRKFERDLKRLRKEINQMGGLELIISLCKELCLVLYLYGVFCLCRGEKRKAAREILRLRNAVTRLIRNDK